MDVQAFARCGEFEKSEFLTIFLLFGELSFLTRVFVAAARFAAVGSIIRAILVLLGDTVVIVCQRWKDKIAGGVFDAGTFYFPDKGKEALFDLVKVIVVPVRGNIVLGIGVVCAVKGKGGEHCKDSLGADGNCIWDVWMRHYNNLSPFESGQRGQFSEECFKHDANEGFLGDGNVVLIVRRNV